MQLIEDLHKHIFVDLHVCNLRNQLASWSRESIIQKSRTSQIDNIVSVGVHWYEVDNTTTQDFVSQISFKLPHHSCFNTSVQLLGITSHRQKCLVRLFFLQPVINILCYVFCMTDKFCYFCWRKVKQIFILRFTYETVMLFFNFCWVYMWLVTALFITFVTSMHPSYSIQEFLFTLNINTNYSPSSFINFPCVLCTLFLSIILFIFLVKSHEFIRFAVTQLVVGPKPTPYLTLAILSQFFEIDVYLLVTEAGVTSVMTLMV